MFRNFVAILLMSLSTFAFCEDESIPKVFVMGAYEELPKRILGTLAIRQYILSKHDIELTFKVFPSKRMPQAVSSGLLDAMATSDITVYDRDRFIHGNYPTHVYNVYVYRNVSRDWNPSWPGLIDFKNAKGVTKNYTYFSTMGFNISQVSSYKAGAMMVNAGRADYWIDVFPRTDPILTRLLKTDSPDYALKFLYPNALRLAFADSETGRYFKTILDEGLAELLANPGEYRRVYIGQYSDIPALVKALDGALKDYFDYILGL